MRRGWWESAGELREVHVDRDGMSLAERLGDYALTELAEDYFRVADIHVSHLSRKSMGVPGTLGRACKSRVPGCSMRTVCLSASVPALGRTRHPFAVSGLEGPSPKIEFVFSASPETIRREPREFDLLRSVGNRQDLAVCAFCLSCLCSRQSTVSLLA